MDPRADVASEDDGLPPEQSWRAGRPAVAALFALVACVNLASVVVDLLARDGAADDRALSWLRLGVVLLFLAVALAELRRRVAVDREGVHVIATVRRRTYPWQDVSEVRSGRPTLFGDGYAYLTLHDDEQVEVPGSRSRVELLSRWHAAMTHR